MVAVSAVLHAPESLEPGRALDGETETADSGATSTSSTAPEPTADGRTRRRLNSYERAVDALLDLIESGNEAPTAQQIAERSGISVRTVFRLTEDIESLHAAAVLRQVQRTAHLYVTLPSTGTFETRLHTLVKNRVTVFETIAPIRRVADRLGRDLGAHR